MVRHGYRHECDVWEAGKEVIGGHRVNVRLSNFEQTPDANLLHHDMRQGSRAPRVSLPGG
jgi:hypothetical protein